MIDGITTRSRSRFEELRAIVDNQFMKQNLCIIPALISLIGISGCAATMVAADGGGGMGSQSLGGLMMAQKPAVRAESPAPRRKAPAGTVKVNIAVMNLEPQNVTPGDAAVIADLMRSNLVNSGYFVVVEKSNMDKILQEQGFQNSGCTSSECAVKLGRVLNVRKMVVGSFGKLMDRYFINLRVVNVESGEVVFSDTARGETVDDIEAGVVKVVDSMIRAEQE